MQSRRFVLCVTALALLAVFAKGYFTVLPYDRMRRVLDSSREALARYHAEQGRYPKSLAAVSQGDCEAISGPLSGVLPPPYDRPLPDDPETLARFRYAANEAGFSLWAGLDGLRPIVEVTAPENTDEYDDRLGIRSEFGPTECLSRFAKMTADLRMLAAALEKYREENGAYPRSPAPGGAENGVATVPAGALGGLAPRYIAALPRAPKPEYYAYDYDYRYASNGEDFALIVADGQFCLAVRPLRPQLADPSPGCRYVGYHSPGWTGFGLSSPSGNEPPQIRPPR
ncbi:MAG: hypothetical protein HQK81_08610 [Desulfovibrionaceae bacterium]|nr:hypothetical protein [Desulfovibrionaceae bacterium]MBF0514111.1 hypothetical protein [Desulfovibrionaceae bacterium]